jgi:hypothetical protein
MCFTDEFRLCSCGADQLSEVDIGWVLTVQNTSKPTLLARGKVRAPEPLTRDQVMSKDSVLAKLNARNCFDFDLDASRMYHLRMRVPGDALWMDFVCHSGGVCQSAGVWTFLIVHPFTKWKTQMEPAARGTLEVVSSSGDSQHVTVAVDAAGSAAARLVHDD